MFYVCKKKETKLGVKYGVMDTEDGVVEYYSPRALLELVSNFGISIEGVLLDSQTGKLRIKVLNPTRFDTVSEEECSTKSETLMPLPVDEFTAENSESSQLPSKEEYISYSDPRVLKFARMAKLVAGKLIYSNAELRLEGIKNVTKEVSYWGKHHVISNVFEYDSWFDVIEQTNDTLCISENKLTTDIIDIGANGFWLVLSYEDGKYSVTKVISNNLWHPVVEEVLRFISPFGYYILKSGDVLFEGTEKELNAWIAGFEVLGTP